jgi:hypothetical protein
MPKTKTIDRDFLPGETAEMNDFARKMKEVFRQFLIRITEGIITPEQLAAILARLDVAQAGNGLALPGHDNQRKETKL